MAGNAIIGALRVVLGADTAALETGLKRASSSASSFGATMGTIARVAGAAMLTLGAAAGVAIKSQINDFDKLSKMSQKIGVPVEELSALKHAAELSDVSIESLEKGIGRLARNMVEGAQGLQTPVRAFEALGISIHNADGSIKTVSQALPEIAEKFSQMKDGPEKTALAMQLLGRAGADLIPMLNGGKAGLAAMTEEARQLGLVIDSETGRTAEAFNDNLTRLTRVMTGVWTQVTANILPALAQFSQFMIDSARNSGFLQAASSALTTAFNGFARAAIILYDNIVPLGKLLALWIGSGLFIALGSAAISVGLAFVKLAVATRTLGLTMAAFEAIRAISTRGMLFIAGVVALAAGAFDNFGEKVKALGGWLSSVLPEGAGEKAAEIFKAMGLNLDGLTADLKSWKAEAGAGGGAFAPLIYNATEAKKLAGEGEAAWKRMAAAGKRVFEETRTPLEEYRNRIAEINMLHWQGHIDAETYARAIAQAQDRMTSANVHAQNLGNALESAFDKAIEKGADFGDILKSLIVDLAKMELKSSFRALLYGNTNQGGTSGGLLGGLFGGGIGKLLGFASGGSFEVGGSGGIDSKLVAFKATPGEMVNVSKGDGGSYGGSGGPVVYNDNRTFNDVTPDLMAKIELRLRAERPKTAQYVMTQMGKQRARDPHFYEPG